MIANGENGLHDSFELAEVDEKVLERGAIVSEFPIASHPAPENFPVRNRIIAGMPIGVIIAERTAK